MKFPLPRQGVSRTTRRGERAHPKRLWTLSKAPPCFSGFLAWKKSPQGLLRRGGHVSDTDTGKGKGEVFRGLARYVFDLLKRSNQMWTKNVKMFPNETGNKNHEQHWLTVAVLTFDQPRIFKEQASSNRTFRCGTSKMLKGSVGGPSRCL